jgi:hypothetical protein
MTTEELSQLRYKILIGRLEAQDALPTLVDLLAACHSGLSKSLGKSVFVSKRTVQEDLRRLREGVLGQVYSIEVVQKKYYRLSVSAPKKKVTSKQNVSEAVPPNPPPHFCSPFYLGGKSPETAKAFFPLNTADFGGQNWLLFLCPEDGTYGAIPAKWVEKAIRFPDFPGWSKQMQQANPVQEPASTWTISPQDSPFWTMYGVDHLMIGEGKEGGLEIHAIPPWWLKFMTGQATQVHEAWMKWEKKLVERLEKKGYTTSNQALSPFTNSLIKRAAPDDIPEQNEIKLTDDELFWVKKWLGLSIWLKALEKAWQVSFEVKGYWQATQNSQPITSEKESKKSNKHQLSLYLNPSEDSDLHFSIWPGSQKQKEPDLFKPSKNLVLSPGQIWMCKTKLYRQVEWNPSTALVRLDLIPTFDHHDD